MGLAGYLHARNLQASTDLAAEAGAAAVGYLPLTAAPRRAAAEQRSAANGH
jgi:hypothetical protein